MRAWAKYIAIVLITAFAVASTVRIAQATMMEIQMSVPMEAGEACADCTGGSGGTGTHCISDCVISSVALPAVETAAGSMALKPVLLPAPTTGLADWRAPPEPFPPKPVS